MDRVEELRKLACKFRNGEEVLIPHRHIESDPKPIIPPGKYNVYDLLYFVADMLE